MEETIEIKNGYSSLEIKGTGSDSALFLNRQLIQFTYLREVGTTMRYQIAKGISDLGIVVEKQFSNFVRLGSLSAEPLSTQFRYILQALTNGKYLINMSSLPTDINSVKINDDEQGYYGCELYGGMIEIIETQSSFNEGKINRYTELINKGIEPIVILLTTENSDNTFIIDGHHKWYAYRRLNKPAKCLLITKLNSEKISKEEGLKLLKQSKIKNSEFEARFL